MISAVFFPADHLPEDFDLQALAFAAARAGLRLYRNERQHALLPRPLPGWTSCHPTAPEATCAA